MTLFNNHNKFAVHCEFWEIYPNPYQSLGDRLKCSFIVMLHKYIICFDLDMYFLIDSNMSTTVVAINKHMHLFKFYNFAVINCKYYNSLKSYIHLKFNTF